MRRTLIQRIGHRLRSMRLHPIRVLVFHQVSESFEPETMWECDWTQIESFKQNILKLKEKYTFISLPEATERLKTDKIRLKDYAVLTADDGWASLNNILPWLAEQRIPVTLFLNPSCLDGKHRHSRESDKLLTGNNVNHLVSLYDPYITVASHGWTHQDCTEMTLDEFKDSVRRSEIELRPFKNKIPFYAFASGRHTSDQVAFLRESSLTPVLVDGVRNENDPVVIHRECIDGKNIR